MADPPIQPFTPPSAIDPWRLLIYGRNPHLTYTSPKKISASTSNNSNVITTFQTTPKNPDIAHQSNVFSPATRQSNLNDSNMPSHHTGAPPKSTKSVNMHRPLHSYLFYTLFAIAQFFFSVSVIHMFKCQTRTTSSLSKCFKEQLQYLNKTPTRYDNITLSPSELSHLTQPPKSHLIAFTPFGSSVLTKNSQFKPSPTDISSSNDFFPLNTNRYRLLKSNSLTIFSHLPFVQKFPQFLFFSMSVTPTSTAPPLGSEAPGFHHNSAPEVSPTLDDTHGPQPASYKAAASDLPTTISYSSDTIYLLCQLRRSQDMEEDIQLATMHNDGTAVKFIESLIIQSFKANPAMSSLKKALQIRDIKFRCLQGSSTPTYSVAFGAILTSTPGSQPVYARHGTPTYKDLEAYLHDFVFERWHCKSHINLDCSPQIISRFFFLIPPCNHPYNKPIAYVSGVSPSVYGRKHLHTKAILLQLHTEIKSKLPSNSKLHNFPYFAQAFGLQVRRNYTFFEGAQEDVYVAYISNHTDHTLISNLVFPSTSTPSPHLKVYNVPTTFIPIPVRPSSHTQGALSAYYHTVRAIAADVRKKRQMVESLPTINTPIFKDPLAPSTRTHILSNEHIITYAVLHSLQKGVSTKLYLKQPPPTSHDHDTLVRSWFDESIRESLFFSKNTYSPHNTSLPAQSILKAVVKNLDASAIQFAAALGVTSVPDPQIPAPKQQHQPKPPRKYTNTPKPIPITLPPTEVIEISPSKLPRQVPAFKPPPPILPHVPLLTEHANASSISHLTPLKRPARSPTSTFSPKSAPPPSSKSKPNALSTTDPNRTPPQSPCSTSSSDTTTNLDPSSEDDDDQPGTQTQQMDNITTTLRSSISSKKQMFIDDNTLSTIAHQVYQADNLQDALLQAKKDLRSEVTKVYTDFSKYQDKQQKKKIRSSKKSKVKKENPAFI